jgi:ferritin-like metal-binding protein YciE
MAKSAFYDLFVTLLKDIFDAENQIMAALPKMIQEATHPELKEALQTHLEETRIHSERLKKIFKALNEDATGEQCSAMKGIVKECNEAAKLTTHPAARDAGIIIACQKIEHYEIASYGSARALARHLNDAHLGEHLDFDEIADTLQQTLNEEGEADEKLTAIAEGGFFSSGINDEAEKEGNKSRTKRVK